MNADRREAPPRRDLKPKRTDDGYTDWHNEWLRSKGLEPYRPPKREPRSPRKMDLGDKLAVAFVVACIITKIIVVVKHFYF